MLKVYSNFRNSDTDPLFKHLRKHYSDKPITIFYERFPLSNEELLINPYNFLIILEPNEFFGLHSKAIQNQHLFTGIISWSNLIWKMCDNAIPFTFNGRVLSDKFLEEIKNKEKKFEISFLCGDKKLTEGHILRHKIYNLKSEIIHPKKWYYVLDDYDKITQTRPGYSNYSKDLSHIPEDVDPIGYGKQILYEESMFNIVIENVKHDNWYNKIGDNFLSKTIPIYWGCPNIEDFGYSKKGIIFFNDENELLNIINSLTPQKYNQMKSYVDYNFEIAQLDHLEIKINNIFNEFFKLNNI